MHITIKPPHTVQKKRRMFLWDENQSREYFVGVIWRFHNSATYFRQVDCFWNVMAQAQKPDLFFRQNGQVHFNRREGGGASVQSTTGNRGVRSSGSNAGYTMFRGSVKSTGYLLHSPVSPFTSPPVRHRVPSRFNWTLRLW
jgi:hypothetical protein